MSAGPPKEDATSQHMSHPQPIRDNTAETSPASMRWIHVANSAGRDDRAHRPQATIVPCLPAPAGYDCPRILCPVLPAANIHVAAVHLLLTPRPPVPPCLSMTYLTGAFSSGLNELAVIVTAVFPRSPRAAANSAFVVGCVPCCRPHATPVRSLSC